MNSTGTHVHNGRYQDNQHLVKLQKLTEYQLVIYVGNCTLFKYQVLLLYKTKMDSSNFNSIKKHE